MTPEFAYFLKVNIAFALFFAFYRLFFYTDTFFQLRRTILLAFFGLAILYPLLNIQEWVKQQQPIADAIYIYSAMLPEVAVEMNGGISGDWLSWIAKSLIFVYLGGVILLCGRFLVQFCSILWLARTSERTVVHGIPVYALGKPAGPFSFFRMIFLHPGSHSSKETDEILTHERTHVYQWHSVDVMVSELICMVCWFNPFTWLLKREVRHNLEYLADHTVIQSGYDSKSYQYHLLDLVHRRPAISLYNNFNVLHLKNRILMMNKKPSAGIWRTKYLVFIPLVGVLMVLSNMETIARLTGRLAQEVTAPEVKSGSSLTLSSSGEVPYEQVFTVVEEMPKFPGGDSELLKFISANIRYPEESKEKREEGRVICAFIVGIDGSILDPQILRSVTPLLDKEAIRVIASMPKFTPGKQRGKAVPVKYTVPITFRLKGKVEQEKQNDYLTEVDQMPQFPGGDGELLKFIAKNVKYPSASKRSGEHGRVICSFIVDKEGLIKEAKVVRGISPSLDEEALRVIRTFPRWVPGKKDGKPVRVLYTVPITFRLT